MLTKHAQKASIVMTIAELITHLQTFDPNKIIMIDDEGDTYSIVKEQIRLWDENTPEDPIAIFI